ncbi:MAG: TolC family protein [FCB group bacterium]|nr:TolC family protein [FCB group bacterium]
MNYRFFTLILLGGISLQAQSRILDAPTMEALILRHNPTLRAYGQKLDIYRGDLLQASLRLNPELDFETGTGGDPETVAGFSQTFELGQKRLKRTRVAEAELDNAHLTYTLKKQEVVTDARSVFIDILLNQKLIILKKERVSIADTFLTAVQTRVTAGRLSPAEVARARIALTSQQVDLNRAQRTLNNLWRQLAAYWGQEQPDYTWAEGDLTFLAILPEEDQLLQALDSAPLYRLTQGDLIIQKAVVSFEKAQRIPDLTISAGIVKTQVPDNTYQAGISIPLPLFNKNQGSIQSGTARLNELREKQRALELRLRTDIARVYSDLRMHQQETTALDEDILPEARKAYRIINSGYLQGKFDFLDVVNARTTLFEAEENYWLALAEYQKAVAQLERLLGQPLNTFIHANEE